MTANALAECPASRWQLWLILKDDRPVCYLECEGEECVDLHVFFLGEGYRAQLLPEYKDYRERVIAKGADDEA